MKQVVQNYKTRTLSVEEVPVPQGKPGFVLVRNAFSLISSGTERTSVEFARKGLLGKVKSRPDDAKKVIKLAKKQGIVSAFKTAMGRLETPVAPGYSSAGLVLDVGTGVDDVKAGDRVACAGGGYAAHAEVVCVPKNLCAAVPENVGLDQAAFTTLGAIALQGVRQADVKVGESVAVIGLGLLGQLTVQLLKASGCQVVGIDLDADKTNLALQCGAEDALVRSDGVTEKVMHMTRGRGVDAVIITAATESNDPFILAPQICRDRAFVVLVGVAALDFPREPYYRKELTLRLARSYGPGRYDTRYEEEGIDYPVGYVRWTEKRNMEAVLALMSEKKLDIAPLISHRFKIDQAQAAYDIVLGKTREKSMGILFEYDVTKEHARTIQLREPVASDSAMDVAIGFVGVGNFARTYLLPNIQAKYASLIGIADIQPHIAKNAAEKFGYEYCTSDYHELLKNERVNTVFIATRHNLHAQLIRDSLAARKHVYCEKPLCITSEELDDIIKAYNAAQEQQRARAVMIGYNRRFAPLTIQTRDFMGKKSGPYMVQYRVNAGPLPSDHWLLDPNQGGGRIIGEVCHFVDFVRFLTQAPLRTVFAQCLGESNTSDNVAVTLNYADGSVGIVTYHAVGDSDFPKERIEIFGDNRVCIIDDFRRATFSYQGREKHARMSQDKGYRNEISAFLNAVRSGAPGPIPFSQIIETSLATFAIHESLHTGKAISIPKTETK
ncbi:hypothetical protein AMJ87_13460 [candidate division WOR_3 bacterium SM23_60]|uniref:Enoyl reductase (ER) domain-containing protein n=1 Tax=candidate division WOR_3 bacterium SM23_60 TaxID=1703780 RepID=A0A0S8G338_UNCW3|nr:MAG: hypothetical protein AMJ87_13460 [candidate division WOR_3 bacterium SM23_60]